MMSNTSASDAHLSHAGSISSSFAMDVTNPKVREFIIIQFMKLSFLAVVLFVAAGRLNYWQAWLFLCFKLLLIPLHIWAYKGRHDLMYERMHPGPGIKLWDRVFWGFYFVFNLTLLIVAALDSGRFHLSATFPIYLIVLGYVGFSLSNVLMCWSIRANKFFSSVVRIQNERGQYVVQDGPYRYIRHPGYAAVLIMEVSLALLFGSLWALIPAFFVILSILFRTHLEDRTLCRELGDYHSYARSTRFKLVPGVW